MNNISCFLQNSSPPDAFSKIIPDNSSLCSCIPTVKVVFYMNIAPSEPFDEAVSQPGIARP